MVFTLVRPCNNPIFHHVWTLFEHFHNAHFDMPKLEGVEVTRPAHSEFVGVASQLSLSSLVTSARTLGAPP